MKRRPLAWLSLIAVSAVLRFAGAAGQNAPDKLKGFDPNGGEGKRIIEIPIDGDIDPGLAAFVDRSFADVKETDVVILQMKTFGGRIDSAVQIRDRLLKSKAPTVVFIDQRAISAGALISLACDTILMTPSASIGAATPVQIDGDGKMSATEEKVVSYMRAEMRGTAEAKGRRGDIAEAMVDKDLEIPGIDEKGKLLTLNTDKALELGIANAKVTDYDDALKVLNLGKAAKVQLSTAWAEKFARFITDPTVSSLLMTVGTIALAAELYTPGMGIGGIIAILCFTLFFGGQYAASLAGWEELVVFLGGVVLLGIEIVVLPGFGVAGILGIIAVVAAIVMSMVELKVPWDVSIAMGYLQEMVRTALLRLVIALVGLGVSVVLFAKFFSKTKIGRQLVLQTATNATEGYVASQPNALLGKKGTATSQLRPSGIAEIDGQRIDVVSVGELIERGTSIEVIRVDGNRVVVRAVS